MIEIYNKEQRQMLKMCREIFEEEPVFQVLSDDRETDEKNFVIKSYMARCRLLGWTTLASGTTEQLRFFNIIPKLINNN